MEEPDRDAKLREAILYMVVPVSKSKGHRFRLSVRDKGLGIMFFTRIWLKSGMLSEEKVGTFKKYMNEYLRHHVMERKISIARKWD